MSFIMGVPWTVLYYRILRAGGFSNLNGLDWPDALGSWCGHRSRSSTATLYGDLEGALSVG